jgi:transposase InsO family protein
MQQTSNKIEKLRSDRGSEYLSDEAINYFADSSIRHELTSPYSPEQNGVAKRENRTLVECVRTMLHVKNLTLKLWGEAVKTVAYLLNRAGSRT